ncbi:DUF6299 family protein [Streptomyces sp. 12297]|uniref:DUF6299 family protein n=1 Tax=Streptomyces sp. NBC_00239 TaxID=2903640 RepID=UPI002E2830D8|nr:DUF6299 family protein [Streptomyces sp. NBC_00239]
MRFPVLAAAALASAAAFSPVAAADSFTGDISVQKEAHISPDGTLTLSGTYRCTEPSPSRTVFVSSSLVQDGKRLGFGGTEARCDGQVHEWRSSGPVDGLMRLGFHDGPAAVDARLMTLESEGGLPSPRPLAGREEPVLLVDDRT